MTPKFSVGEVCLLQSVDHPELNGDVTVLKIVNNGEEYTSPDGQLHRLGAEGFAYVLDRDAANGNPFWNESALRKKHDPSDYGFYELMENIKDMATA